MNQQHSFPGVAAVLTETLSASPRPLDLDYLVAEVASWHPQGDASRGDVEDALDGIYQAVPVGRSKYGWLSNLLADTMYCHPLSASEMGSGRLLLDELEHAVFYPDFFQDSDSHRNQIEISFFGGETVRVRPELRKRLWTLTLGEPFVKWLFDLGMENRDDILVRVLDARAGRYEFRPRMRELRDERAIEKRNIRMAMLAEEVVTEYCRRRDFMPVSELVARMIGREFFMGSPPTDDMHYVLSEYSMLRYVEGKGYQIDIEAASRIVGKEDATGAGVGSHSDHIMVRPHRDYADSAQGPIGDAPGDNLESFQEITSGKAGSTMDDEICPAYQDYLDSYEQDAFRLPRLQHEEFHLLEAELDLLVQLEIEFGGLLPEQEARKQALASRLYIDPDTLTSMGWDLPDDPSFEDPPFWMN